MEEDITNRMTKDNIIEQNMAGPKTVDQTITKQVHKLNYIMKNEANHHTQELYRTRLRSNHNRTRHDSRTNTEQKYI